MKISYLATPKSAGANQFLDLTSVSLRVSVTPTRILILIGTLAGWQHMNYEALQYMNYKAPTLL